MKPMTFTTLILLGLLLSFGGTVGIHGLNYFFLPADSFMLVISFLSMVYSAYILLQSRQTVGRLVFFLTYLTIIGLILALNPTPILVITVNMLFIWLSRSIYFHRNYKRAFFDGALTIASVFVVYWVLTLTQSWLLAFWSFFLMQSMLMLLPEIPENNQLENKFIGNSQFCEAYKKAQSAITLLTQSRH